MMEINEDQLDELTALASIYEHDISINLESYPFSGFIIINIELEKNITVGNGANTYAIDHMPPIYLYFNLPEDYPNSSPPNFELKCSWLDQNQIIILSEMLKQRFQIGFVALYDWTNILREELLLILKISDKIVVNNDQLQEVIFYNEKKLNKIFAATYFECSICFNQIIGEQCAQLKICRHIFCKTCLSSFLKVHIGEGSVMLVKCPAYQCTNDLPLFMIKELVPPDLFERYDNLLLQSSLDLMNDIAYCPRLACNSVVIVDKDLRLGSCPACSFSFCIHCKQTFHGIAQCSIKSNELKIVIMKYKEASIEEKQELDIKYGKKMLESLVENFENDSWLKSNTKLCPSCKVNIEKFDGCNKVVCTKCLAFFCWLCQSEIKGYDHFSDTKSKCYQKLFDGVPGN